MNQINLVPIEYNKRLKRKWYIIFGLIGGAVSVGLTITMALIPVFKINQAEQEQEKLIRELAMMDMVETKMILEETEKAYMQNSKAAKLLEILDVPSHITRQTMDVVVGSVPKGLRMNQVIMDQTDTNILIAGQARSITNVAQYVVQLYNTGQFNIIEYSANPEGDVTVPGWMDYTIEIQPKNFIKEEMEEIEETEEYEEAEDEVLS